MSVFYGGPKPSHITGSSVEESGFGITVWDKNGRNITGRITNSAQTRGAVFGRGDALQFLVKTFLDENPKDGTDDNGVDGDEITVRVTGLRNLQKTFIAPPATMQDDPLER